MTLTRRPISTLPEWFAGNYYGTDTNISASGYSAGQVFNGLLYAIPVVVPRTVAIDRIGAEITTPSAGQTFRVGIYDRTGVRGRPGALIVESAALAADSAAFVEGTIAATLPAGVVWFCIQAGDNTMRFRFTVLASQIAVIGKSAGGGSAPERILVVSQSYGAFPAAFPAGATLNTAGPVVNVRAA